MVTKRVINEDEYQWMKKIVDSFLKKQREDEESKKDNASEEPKEKNTSTETDSIETDKLKGSGLDEATIQIEGQQQPLPVKEIVHQPTVSSLPHFSPISLSSLEKKIPKRHWPRAKRFLEAIADTPIQVSQDARLFINKKEIFGADGAKLIRVILSPVSKPQKPLGYDAFTTALRQNGLSSLIYPPPPKRSSPAVKKTEEKLWYKLGPLF